MRITPLILAVALFMEQMDSTVIATSLPAIAADIGAEPISLKLALTAYFVALAIFIPLSGWMADRFGARRIFRIAIAVFVLGSICCAFSYSLETFVGSRFLQGIGASMMTPIARLVLVRATPRHELVAAMAWLSVPALIGPLAGPPLGGFLTTYLSWHWIFWINVPIGLIGIVLVTIFLPKIEARTPRPIDVPGFFLAGISFAGIIFGLSVISLPAIPAVAGYLAIGVGAAAGALYYLQARRAPYPLLDPRLFRHSLFRHSLFRSAIVGGSLFRVGIGAFPFLLPLMLQLSFGLNPFESGMITFITAIGAIASKFLAERVYAAFGFRRVLLVSTTIGCVFLAVNALFTPGTPHLYLYLALLAGGLSRSIFFTGINALVFTDIEEHEASQATGINAVGQQLSVAFGVALAGGVLEISSGLGGGELRLEDFHIAWYVVAGVALLSVLPFLRLPPDAGSHVSGHRHTPPAKPAG
ncbi:MFS transporter [Devosia sp.]|uniref:MFS transporter n=1 Tax=Devosia sp. TaxID=1871048 RepID=UPI0037539771